MKINNSSGKFIGAGIISAIAASLCCITPVLALIAGSSGLAASFYWLDPARPYLISSSFLVLGFAWYQKLKPRKADEIDCDCEVDEKPSFLQSKKFLGIVTVFAVIMMAFPYYSFIFYSDIRSNVTIIESENIETVSFEISGMTCSGCEEHVKRSVSKLAGFIEVHADFKNGGAEVKFDKTKSSLDEVIASINETGYTVTNHSIIENSL